MLIPSVRTLRSRLSNLRVQGVTICYRAQLVSALPRSAAGLYLLPIYQHPFTRFIHQTRPPINSIIEQTF